MAYSTGILNKRVAVCNPASITTEGKFGRQSAGRSYEYVGTFWAAVDFNKGQKSLREGAVDAYDTLMIRMRWNSKVNVRSMIVWEGRTFSVRSCNIDKQLNQIQLLVREDPGQDLSGLVKEATTPTTPTTPNEETTTTDENGTSNGSETNENEGENNNNTQNS